MDEAYLEHLNHQPDTISEADRASANWVGSQHPDRAWICSDRDAWYPNPYYQGPPQPHPEEVWYEEEFEPLPLATQAWVAGWVSIYEPDEIPF